MTEAKKAQSLEVVTVRSKEARKALKMENGLAEPTVHSTEAVTACSTEDY